MKLDWNKMKTTIMATWLALVFLTCGMPCAVAGEVLLGSPDFRPSPEHPFGWRGDGSGKSPGAPPPVHWGRTAVGVKGLRFQATKPKAGETGKQMTDGVIREWLVLGPVPRADENNFIKGLTNKLDSAFSPGENDKAADLAWKKVETDTAMLDFYDLYGEDGVKTSVVAFAHAYLYSETKCKLRLVKEIDLVMGGGLVRTYVNGAILKDREFVLEQGWNSIMFRVPSGARVPADRTRKEVRKSEASRVAWYVQPVLYGAPGGETVSENIRWTARVPGWNIAAPVIAGDRIFVLGDMRTLSCVDKMSGKILWARTATLYDAATDEEKKANPEIFKELEPLLARLAELDNMFVSGVTEPDKFITEKVNLENKIDGLMAKVDKEKYKGGAGPIGEPGHSSRTPVTDGKNIYVNYHPCLTVCYDMDGNRKWIHQYGVKNRSEHGFHSSPCLVAGKLVVATDKYIALDAQTGQVAWELPGSSGSSLVGGASGGEAIVFVGGKSGFAADKQQVGAIRVKDGSVISKPSWNWATPVKEGNMVYTVRSLGMGDSGTAIAFLDIARVDPDKLEHVKTVTMDNLKFIRIPRLESNLASPLCHDGLVYIVDADGLLTVVDVEKYEIIYRKFLDIDNGPGGPARGVQGASPALGGKYIYVFGNHGTCVVFEPGRQYKQVAKNRIECFCIGSTDQSVQWHSRYSTQLEQTLSGPVFDGSRMYYRGLINLYCVEEKEEKTGKEAGKDSAPGR